MLQPVRDADITLWHRRGSGKAVCVFRMAGGEFRSGASGAARALQDVERHMSAAMADRVPPVQTLCIPTPAPSGYGIGLYADRAGIYGRFGGLGQDFESLADALAWTRRALTQDYRLHTISVGSRAVEWMLEETAARNRIVLAARRPRWFGRWGARRHDYRINDVLPGGLADSERGSGRNVFL